jgi:hypothetical protein
MLYGFGPTGAMSSTNASGNWRRDVIGVSFVFDRHGSYWSDGEVGIDKVGIRYWDIDTAQEYCEKCEIQTYGGSFSPTVYDQSGSAAAPKAMSTWEIRDYGGCRDFYRYKNMIWIGCYVQLSCTDRGGATHTRSFAISDLAPIYQSFEAGVEPVVPQAYWTPNDKRLRIA